MGAGVVSTAERELIHQREPNSAVASAVAISVDGCQWLGFIQRMMALMCAERGQTNQPNMANGHICGQKNKQLAENS